MSEVATVLVCDTNILCAEPQPYLVPELLAYGPACYLIPASVVGELDLLAQRPEMRQKARAALNVLKGFVERGAAQTAVSAGAAGTLRVGRAEEEVCGAGLDSDYADDRIIASAIFARASGAKVVVATTDFAMYVKVLTHDLGAEIVGRLAAASTTSPAALRRETRSFEAAWDRVLNADSAWKALWRANKLLSGGLIRELVTSAQATGEPAHVLQVVEMFRSFQSAWSTGVHWRTIIKQHLGIDPPVDVDLSPKQVWVPSPGPYANLSRPGWGPGEYRSETADERAIRLRIEERNFNDREAFIIDSVVYALEPVVQWVLDQTATAEG